MRTRVTPKRVPSDTELLERAGAARANAYAPYSNYHVGAVALTADGSIYPGANIENASYGLSVCGERVAIFKAASEGHRAIDTVAVVTDDGAPPCGACRQVMAEFGVKRVVIGSARKALSKRGELKGRGRVRVRTLRQLLPDAFTPDRLLKR